MLSVRSDDPAVSYSKLDLFVLEMNAIIIRTLLLRHVYENQHYADSSNEQPFLIVIRLQLHESESSSHINILRRTTCGGNIQAVEVVIVSLFQETKGFVKVKKKLENYSFGRWKEIILLITIHYTRRLFKYYSNFVFEISLAGISNFSKFLSHIASPCFLSVNIRS